MYEAVRKQLCIQYDIKWDTISNVYLFSCTLVQTNTWLQMSYHLCTSSKRPINIILIYTWFDRMSPWWFSKQNIETHLFWEISHWNCGDYERISLNERIINIFIQSILTSDWLIHFIYKYHVSNLPQLQDKPQYLYERIAAIEIKTTLILWMKGCLTPLRSSQRGSLHLKTSYLRNAHWCFGALNGNHLFITQTIRSILEENTLQFLLNIDLIPPSSYKSSYCWIRSLAKTCMPEYPQRRNNARQQERVHVSDNVVWLQLYFLALL